MKNTDPFDPVFKSLLDARDTFINPTQSRKAALQAAKRMEKHATLALESPQGKDPFPRGWPRDASVGPRLRPVLET